MKIPVGLLEKAESEYPKTPLEMVAISAANAVTPARELDGPMHFELRRTMVAAAAREAPDLAFERYLGTNGVFRIARLHARFQPISQPCPPIYSPRLASLNKTS